MRPRDRQLRIADLVQAQGKVTVDELADRFAASAETIRRDLTLLAANGKIRKVHGGATAARNFGEGPFAQRMQLNGQAKRIIAQKARQLVTPGDTVFIDTGSTTLVIADELSAIDDLTVVTNSAEIARVVASANKTVHMYLLGGSYNEDNRQTCGSMALAQLECFHANLTLLTAGTVAAQAGVMDFNHDEAMIARGMIARSDRVALLVDSSKFDRVAPFVVSALEQIDVLVCESPPGGELAEALAEARVEVMA